MEKARVFKRRTTAGILPVVLLLVFSLWGCEKKPKTTLHTDVLEAEINGTKYTFEDLSHAGSIGKFFNLQGEYKGDNGVNTFIVIGSCNLNDWPNSKTFPLVTEHCPDFNGESFSQVYIAHQFSTTRYITPDSVTNPNSTITFEKFDVIDGNNFEIKGTFKMALARVAGPNPLSSPDSCFVTGRIHLKRPRRTTVD